MRAELRPVARLVRSGPPESKEFALTLGWGHPSKVGATMPGRGRSEQRAYTVVEREAIVSGAKALGIEPAEAFRRLGDTTCDVYLNPTTYWCNVPQGVWEYYIGGYQVMKKWLSYREFALLGRPLTVDEIEEVTNMARRMAALRLLEPALDANYKRILV